MAYYKSRNDLISDEEVEHIKYVVLKAEEMNIKERERIDLLIDNLERLKLSLLGNGAETCIHCGETFHFLGPRGYSCADCSKMTCRRCRIVTTLPKGRPLQMCKLCSEAKEIKKKSGNWLCAPTLAAEQPAQQQEPQLNVFHRLHRRLSRN